MRDGYATTVHVGHSAAQLLRAHAAISAALGRAASAVQNVNEAVRQSTATFRTTLDDWWRMPPPTPDVDAPYCPRNPPTRRALSRGRPERSGPPAQRCEGPQRASAHRTLYRTQHR